MSPMWGGKFCCLSMLSSSFLTDTFQFKYNEYKTCVLNCIVSKPRAFNKRPNIPSTNPDQTPKIKEIHPAA